jgi:hypothetical protein
MKDTNLLQANMKLGAFLKTLQLLHPLKSELDVSNLFGQAFDAVADQAPVNASQIFGFERSQIEALPAYRKLHKSATSPAASVFGTQARRMHRDMGD